MCKSSISTIPILLLGIFSVLPAQGVSRNCPKLSDVEDTLKISGELHREVNEIKRLGSLKTDDTYFHIFYGKSYDGSCRVMIFNNDEQYLGFYNTDSYVPTEGSKLSKGIRLYKHDRQGQHINGFISMGRYGPWEKVISQNGDVLSFTPTNNYTFPTITSASKQWFHSRNGTESIINARLALVDDDEDFIYLQLTDSGAVRLYAIKWFSRDDQKYLRSLKKKSI